jgi:hypothetical protein
MTVQTSVSAKPAVGRPGLELDSSVNDKVSWIAQEDIPFGRYVVQTTEGYCELPDSLAEITGNDGGVALIDPNLPSGEGYKQGDVVTVLRRGRVWVETEEAVTANSPAFVRAIVTGEEQQGAWRSDADGTDAVAPNRTSFIKGNSAAGLAVVELISPQGT